MRIVWTGKARGDLDEIFDHILQESPRAAVNTLDRIEQIAGYLADHPGMGRPGRVRDTRELIIPGLPWILPYLTGPETITILRVIHAAMQWPGDFEDDPDQKSGRS